MTEEQYAEIRAQLASNTTEHESYNRRLREHDERLQKLSDVLVVLERLTSSIKSLTDKIGVMDDAMKAIDHRLAVIELEPATKWKSITWEIIKYLALALIGVAVGWVIKGTP